MAYGIVLGRLWTVETEEETVNFSQSLTQVLPNSALILSATVELHKVFVYWWSVAVHCAY